MTNYVRMVSKDGQFESGIHCECFGDIFDDLVEMHQEDTNLTEDEFRKLARRIWDGETIEIDNIRYIPE